MTVVLRLRHGNVGKVLFPALSISLELSNVECVTDRSTKYFAQDGTSHLISPHYRKNNASRPVCDRVEQTRNDISLVP